MGVSTGGKDAINHEAVQQGFGFMVASILIAIRRKKRAILIRRKVVAWWVWWDENLIFLKNLFRSVSFSRLPLFFYEVVALQEECCTKNFEYIAVVVVGFFLAKQI